MEDDFQLLDRWQAGDADAGSLLFRRHFDTLMRFFYAKASGDVEDLVQNTMLQCVQATERFRREASFRTFLFAIARKTLLAYYRKSRSNSKIDPLVSSVHELATTPSEAVAREERASIVVEAMRRIPVDHQILLELHYWEGLPPAEVAKVLQLHPGTTRTRLFRARVALREMLAQLNPGRELDDAGLDALLNPPTPR